MPSLRVAQATLSSDKPKLRAAKITASGSGRNPVLRVARFGALGGNKPILQPFADRTVEAYDVVTLTALKTPLSDVPDSYAWRQVSGPPTPFSDNGASITFTAPTAVEGAAVVFGVIASLNSQDSLETTATVRALPHLYWVAGASSWIPLTRTKLAGS
jgi:hypothetical protein